MNLKRIVLFCIIFSFTLPGFAQKSLNEDPLYRWMRLVNFGTYLSTSGSKPYFHTNWNFHLFLGSTEHFNFATEVDYINKRHDAKLVGWKFTPLNASYCIWRPGYEMMPRLLVGCSASYLSNQGHLSNAWLVTPHVTFDVAFCTLKMGYDYDIRNKVGQFGVTAQISLSTIPALIHFASKGN